MGKITIVGIGNRYRGDDAAGWAVIDKLIVTSKAIKLVKQKGDIAELIDFFAKYKSVYLVDACLSNAPVGSWQRIDLNKQTIIEDNLRTSTHGFSVSQAISLAKNLSELPTNFILYAINGDNYNIGDQLSLSVAKSVDQVVKALLNEEDIKACMNKA